MALFKATKQVFYGGRIQDAGYVHDFPDDLKPNPLTWVSVDAELPASAAPAKSAEELFGPAIPAKEKPQAKSKSSAAL